MAEYKDVQLVDGRTVRVYRPPLSRILAMVERKDPEPTVPIQTEATATGRVVKMSNPNDPGYIEAMEQWQAREAQRREEQDMLEALYMLKDEEVPEGWDVREVAGDIATFYDPEWKPREGQMGRKLDYIQWDLLADVVDLNRVQMARAELSGIDMAEVASIEASFRPQVEG